MINRHLTSLAGTYWVMWLNQASKWWRWDIYGICMGITITIYIYIGQPSIMASFDWPLSRQWLRGLVQPEITVCRPTTWLETGMYPRVHGTLMGTYSNQHAIGFGCRFGTKNKALAFGKSSDKLGGVRSSQPCLLDMYPLANVYRTMERCTICFG